MSKTTIRQGDVTATLSELAYHQAQGFQEQGAWYATEEVIAADSDKELECGEATIIHGSTEFPVNVTVMEFEKQPGEEDEPVCQIEIDYAVGLPKLALALGLLDHLSPKQRKALVG